MGLLVVCINQRIREDENANDRPDQLSPVTPNIPILQTFQSLMPVMRLLHFACVRQSILTTSTFVFKYSQKFCDRSNIVTLFSKLVTSTFLADSFTILLRAVSYLQPHINSL
jgi:hypothetical protein